ncbi:MAG: cysteine desulfurase [Clostridiales bacterium]|nr:cysteine desulfurase [Clostridiales bacterium]
MIYLDNAATTPVSPAAADAARDAMLSGWGNPSARYPAGKDARARLLADRNVIASALGCKPTRAIQTAPPELLFTSCGSESDNWALRAGAERGKRRGKHIITTAIEHAAVLETCKALEGEGYEVTYLPPNRESSIDPADFAAALRPDTILASMMLVNNELGTVLPVKDCARLLKQTNPQALFHTDAVQAFLKIPFTPRALGVDMVSLSGHKVHAPKGIGALYIREGLRLRPLIYGGGQEGGLRSGTEATAQIAAFAAAVGQQKCTFAQDTAQMKAVKAHLLARLAAELPEVTPIVVGEAPHILALTMAGYKSEPLVQELGDKGICVSAGSACHRGKPSHVYAALGLSKEQREGAFRVSFSGQTREADVDALVDALKVIRDTRFKSMS